MEEAVALSRKKSLELSETPRDIAEKRFAYGLKLYLEKMNSNRPADKWLKFTFEDVEYKQVVSDLIDYFRCAKDAKYDTTCLYSTSSKVNFNHLSAGRFEFIFSR